MVEKTKKSPLPDRTATVERKEEAQKQAHESSSEPTFIRGTIDPPTKKER